MDKQDVWIATKSCKGIRIRHRAAKQERAKLGDAAQMKQFHQMRRVIEDDNSPTYHGEEFEEQRATTTTTTTTGCDKC